MRFKCACIFDEADGRVDGSVRFGRDFLGRKAVNADLRPHAPGQLRTFAWFASSVSFPRPPPQLPPQLMTSALLPFKDRHYMKRKKEGPNPALERGFLYYYFQPALGAA
jgi:hypothetical protein